MQQDIIRMDSCTAHLQCYSNGGTLKHQQPMMGWNSHQTGSCCSGPVCQWAMLLITMEHPCTNDFNDFAAMLMWLYQASQVEDPLKIFFGGGLRALRNDTLPPQADRVAYKAKLPSQANMASCNEEGPMPL